MRRGEAGASTIETTFIIGAVILLIVGFAQIAVWDFTRGAMHSAADQAARAGAVQPGDGVAACETRLQQALGNMLTGPSRTASAGCADDGEVVTARVEITMEAWIPPMQDADFVVTSQVRKERDP